ncbi:nitrous oxide reductase family maturation protein NosD [Sphingobacterium chuzhouense]|uniref:Nitrous oxide reductase family maturation protein NosD n=1 Tax=Sphingobacterium chuzhouense TaxID=1742264 RepID=A0ABR7XRY3_9SPHI|nr:nitrous oxide reductase family maturation protein NosD [Sphingobacterium chuzhouense]MBD1421934.1 nitrous oxide reductase family maturation protein NosD [Sphingobacterium chuzhouense]
MKNFLFHILITGVYLCMVVGTTRATTIHVGKQHVIQSITQAIAKAENGDTIIVHGGLYQEENILITKSLSLIGIDNPVIDAQKKHEPVSIEANHVTIKGFTIKNSAHSSIKDVAAIKIYNGRYVSIQNNILDNNFFGIYLQNAKNCHIENNRLQTYGETERLVGNGIHAWKSDSITILNNEIFGHRDGIYLEFVTHTQVDRNVAQHNLRYGLHFMFSHDNQYHYNTFKANGAGVAVMYTQRVRMEHNIFEENWGDATYGLLLKDITDSHIQHNTFVKNTTGIFMEGSNRIQIEQNSFENNGWAIKIFTSCMHNTLSRNTFIQNTFDVATNGGKMTNTFQGNYWDNYEGYDLNKDGIGDVPHHPVSLFSMLVERYPAAMLLFRSFMVTLFDRSEKMIPSLTPENLKDEEPLMKPIRQLTESSTKHAIR